MSGKVPLYIRASGDALILEVVVTPRSKKTRMTGFHGGYPKIALAAPPVEGKANDELLDFFRELFKLPPRSVEIVRGDTGRRKVLLIRKIPLEKVVQVLENAMVS